MKTAKDYIREIKTIEPNIRHLLDSGKINGSLLIDIEKAMKEYATEAIKSDRERVANHAKTTRSCSVWNCEGESVDKESILTLPIELK